MMRRATALGHALFFRLIVFVLLFGLSPSASHGGMCQTWTGSHYESRPCVEGGGGGSSSSSYSAPVYDPVAEQHSQANYQNDQGLVLYNSKNFAGAMDYFRQALSLWPENYTFQRNLQNAEQAYFNAEGIRYYENKNWATAVEYFRKSLAVFPDDQTVKRNLSHAEDALQQELREQERKRQEARAAADMRATISNMGALFNTPTPPSSGLDFSGKPSAPPPSSGLDFMSGTPAASPPPPPPPGGAGKIKGLDSRAVKEAETNLDSTRRGLSGAVFDNKEKGVPGRPEAVYAVPEASKVAPMSEKAKNDPRMIAGQKELADAQAKRQKLEEQRNRLSVERNRTTDPVKMRGLTRELDKTEKDYQANLLAVSNKTAEIEKLKRTIDTEVEAPAKQSFKGTVP